MLPIDIYNGLNNISAPKVNNDVWDKQNLEYTIMVYLWRGLYVSLLFMSYLVIPYFRIELESGITDDDERRKKNIIYIVVVYSVIGAIGAVFLAYLLVTER